LTDRGGTRRRRSRSLLPAPGDSGVRSCVRAPAGATRTGRCYKSVASVALMLGSTQLRHQSAGPLAGDRILDSLAFSARWHLPRIGWTELRLTRWRRRNGQVKTVHFWRIFAPGMRHPWRIGINVTNVRPSIVINRQSCVVMSRLIGAQDCCCWQ
jgi:hypothetical protein